MIRSRMGKNFLAAKGLVKKSAMFSSVGTYGTSMTRDSTMSRMKKCRRSDMFHLGVMFRVVGSSARSGVVHAEWDREIRTHAKFAGETTQVHYKCTAFFFGGLGITSTVTGGGTEITPHGGF